MAKGGQESHVCLGLTYGVSIELRLLVQSIIVENFANKIVFRAKPVYGAWFTHQMGQFEIDAEGVIFQERIVFVVFRDDDPGTLPDQWVRMIQVTSNRFSLKMGGAAGVAIDPPQIQTDIIVVKFILECSERFGLKRLFAKANELFYDSARGRVVDSEEFSSTSFLEDDRQNHGIVF